jgi:hypothetical protein
MYHKRKGTFENPFPLRGRVSWWQVGDDFGVGLCLGVQWTIMIVSIVLVTGRLL